MGHYTRSLLKKPLPGAQISVVRSRDARRRSATANRDVQLRSVGRTDSSGPSAAWVWKLVDVARPSVHGHENVETDLSGKNVLISLYLYYWGAKAIELPRSLRSICHQMQGHKSESNCPHFETFVTWLDDVKLTPGQMCGWPDFMVDWATVSSCSGCSARRIDGENDNAC